MSTEHHVQVPKAYWGLKIAQTVIAALVFALSCYEVAVIPSSYAGFTIFVGLYTIGVLVYYFVSIHSQPQIYNWIAFLVLECIAVVFWLVVWAILAAALAVTYVSYSYFYKRDVLSKRITVGEYNAAGAIVYVILALGLIEWILFIVTLVFLGKGVHQHRKSGRPMVAGGSSSGAWNTASKEEKHDMQPMPAQGNYYAPDQQQQAMPQQQQPQYNGGFTAAEAPGARY